MEFETIIGLEIHVQLNTKSKMFCRCDNYSVNVEPNTHTCEVCTGLPGVLPVTNKQAILWAVQAGLALGCKINNFTKFDRKHYFYPDLPKGYQISQYDQPLAEHGEVEIEVTDKDKSYKRKIGITRVHIEEDAGKLIHPENTEYSLVDLNRAGTPLMEIVSEPDIRSPKEARIFVENLRSIMRYLGISEANMEEGNLRCDANISLRKKGEKKFGAKVEIKNMNSFKMIERAMAYEEERQAKLLDIGEKIKQETRGWNDAKGVTTSQRSKEEAQDYRYFPEPDLPPIEFSKLGLDLEKVKKELPELPEARAIRFEKDYGLSSADSQVLTNEKELSELFEEVVSLMGEKKDSAKRSSNWILSEYLGILNKEKVLLKNSKITAQNLAELLAMIEKREVSGKIAKDIFIEMFKTGESPAVIVKTKDIKMVDSKDIEKIVDKVLKENPKSIEDYKKGKTNAFGFLVGQVMKETQGQADPKTVNELLNKKIK